MSTRDLHPSTSGPTVEHILETMEYGPAPESAEPARRWIEAHDGRFGFFIGGTWVPPEHEATFETVNPADGVPLAAVGQAVAEQVDAAVSAARSALESWSALPGHSRARYLYALARAIQKHARLFAVLETLDNGKPIRESRDIDVPLVARHFYHHAGWAQLLEREFPGYVPVGVVGQIIPWNFPLLMLAWKVAPALAAGNTVVLKPAEYTPLTALLFAEIAEQVGLPPGVFNAVTGDGDTGKLLVAHPGIDKIAFTGSTEVGRYIRRETAGTGKRLTLELGGKSPFVVFEDADLDSVVEGVVDAIWFNQGQVCCAGSRLLAQEGVAEVLLAKLRARMESLRIGAPLDKAVDMGAIIAPVQLDRIRDLVARGQDEGATVWQPSWASPKEGYFYPPTLCTDVAPASTLAQVEVFGPVLVAMTFRTPEEAVALANNTTYGLAASVWSENINLALDVAPKIKAGVVWVNASNLFDAASGFGGYRESGFGREGGREGMWEYLRPAWEEATGEPVAPAAPPSAAPTPATGPAIDRTYKQYIGGRQVRPDSGYSRAVVTADGTVMAQVADGNRKDIRNAVEAAHAAAGWGRRSGHERAQILYYLAENLDQRREEFAGHVMRAVGCSGDAATREVAASMARLFTYAAWADKHDGAVHDVPLRGVTIAMHEPIGVLAVVAPEESALLGLVSVVAPPLAMGNTVVVIPSERYPTAALELTTVLDASDVPPGTVNVVAGDRGTLAQVLAEHLGVDGLWFFGDRAGAAAVELASAANLKRTWTVSRPRDWHDPVQAEGPHYLRQATQVKNIWIPYGE
jgi:aldehyde dehydrogenase (NAD+)